MQNLFQVPFLKEKALLLFLYFLFAAILSPYHTYFIHLADTFQYIVIAENYSKGNFVDALNSYWSPLFSWLLAGFLKTGMEAFSAIQFLQIIIGSFSLTGIFILIPLRRENKVLLLLLQFSFVIPKSRKRNC